MQHASSGKKRGQEDAAEARTGGRRRHSTRSIRRKSRNQPATKNRFATLLARTVRAPVTRPATLRHSRKRYALSHDPGQRGTSWNVRHRKGDNARDGDTTPGKCGAAGTQRCCGRGDRGSGCNEASSSEGRKKQKKKKRPKLKRKGCDETRGRQTGDEKDD